jgi:hypothetical protein
LKLAPIKLALTPPPMVIEAWTHKTSFNPFMGPSFKKTLEEGLKLVLWVQASISIGGGVKLVLWVQASITILDP